MTPITSDHLARTAIVYVRQSTVMQVAHNLESQRRQYGLADRARQLGWTDVVVIDDDLGKSGGGVARPGFEKLLAAICDGRVGAVVSLEASRLARNGRDWHTLLEFCGLVNTLIVDENGVYDPRLPDDRMLLGMKGTMSEMELSVFRQRSMEAIKQKARRGELFLTVPVGYIKATSARIEKDPDRRVQDAVGLVFRKFGELHTIRQVLVWFRQERVLLPAMTTGGSSGQKEWKLPGYHTLWHMLKNPIYAGAYAFGRRATRVTIEDGRKRVARGFRATVNDWEVLIQGHHEGYISWEEFERNQKLIADNANGKSFITRGSVRQGTALLVGLLRCGRCGRRLTVGYGGKGNAPRYACRGAFNSMAANSCISFGGLRVDRAVAEEVLGRVRPLGVEAALEAAATAGQEHSEKSRQLDFALQQARYEAARAARQYDAVDPENRLIAAELERRWNERLLAVRALEQELESLSASSEQFLTEFDRERLIALGADLERAWESPGVKPETRKRIIRTLIVEIIVDIGKDVLNLVIHWQGGDHTQLTVKKNRGGQTRWATPADVVDLARVLARQMPDKGIAAVLNRAGKTTGHGKSWTCASVCSLRRQYKIDIYREGERAQRGEATLDEAAEILAVSPSTVRRLIAGGTLPARQLCKGAPWIIRHDDLAHMDVRRAADMRRSRSPAPEDRRQDSLGLTTT